MDKISERDLGLNKLVICIFIYFACTGHANAQGSQGIMSVGLAFSGPVFGVSLRTKLSDKYSARLIYFDNKWNQIQIQVRPDSIVSGHALLGIGRIAGEGYVIRGAIGKDWYANGPLSLGADVGLNIPILDPGEDDEMLKSAAVAIFFGVGVHYEFR